MAYYCPCICFCSKSMKWHGHVNARKRADIFQHHLLPTHFVRIDAPFPVAAYVATAANSSIDNFPSPFWSKVRII